VFRIALIDIAPIKSTFKELTVPQPAPAMTVPLLDLKVQYQALAAEIMPVLEKLCASQHFILGSHVANFEKSVAAYSACAHGVGVSSGTDALLLALMALGLKSGDEIITTPYTFFATGGTIARTGARPVFCDIDARTYNIEPRQVRAFIDRECERRGDDLIHRATGGRVRALMPVHLYGQCADMDPLLEIAREFGLKIIEDAAQAIGAEYRGGRRAGSIGDIGCLSFFPSKNLGAFGDAGMCTTQSPELAEFMRILRVHGGKPKYFHAFVGGNFRLDEIQAAVLEVKLKYLDGWTAGRQRNAAYYEETFRAAGLAERIGLPRVEPGHRHIWNQYVIRVSERTRLRECLTQAGIGTEIYYPVPLHLQKCFEYLGYRQGDFPESERAANETLALPIYPELSQAQLQYVVGRIAAFFG
jgi:dTDP-4-amino-4,6-dideoxygalactose transaminase